MPIPPQATCSPHSCFFNTHLKRDLPEESRHFYPAFRTRTFPNPVFTNRIPMPGDQSRPASMTKSAFALIPRNVPGIHIMKPSLTTDLASPGEAFHRSHRLVRHVVRRMVAADVPRNRWINPGNKCRHSLEVAGRIIGAWNQQRSNLDPNL